MTKIAPCPDMLGGIPGTETNCPNCGERSAIGIDMLPALEAAIAPYRTCPPAATSEADVERVAVALWRQDAERAAPNVAKMRTPEAFRELDPYTVSLWASQARAAIAAMGPSDRDAIRAEMLAEVCEWLEEFGSSLTNTGEIWVVRHTIDALQAKFGGSDT